MESSELESFRQKKYSESVAHLRWTIALDDSRPRVHFILGQAYQKLGHMEDATRGHETFRQMEVEQRKSRFTTDVDKS